ncbi:MAG: hypothetical protein QOC61_548 [Acidobacteriota bacterium]|jgi:hypothetical protein|nr:hypothetical protein [Acidobacteriota bacterium]MDT5261544.1 hypothetical protein [Acidobacteriota bacterium]MDT7778310.1 hypothetical protein [Acidobacteriota bacterium]
MSSAYYGDRDVRVNVEEFRKELKVRSLVDAFR